LPTISPSYHPHRNHQPCRNTPVTRRAKKWQKYPISQTNFQWPTQLNPDSTAWNLWIQAIQTIYTKPGLPTTLIKLLGPWNESAATACTWFTTYNPSNESIVIQNPGQEQRCYMPTSNTRQRLCYEQQTPNLHQHPTSYPVTISTQKRGFRVDKQIHSIPVTPPLTLPTLAATLQGKIYQTLPHYTPELWSKIESIPNQPTEKLAQYVWYTNGPIYLVSNASLNNHN